MFKSMPPRSIQDKPKQSRNQAAMRHSNLQEEMNLPFIHGEVNAFQGAGHGNIELRT